MFSNLFSKFEPRKGLNNCTDSFYHCVNDFDWSPAAIYFFYFVDEYSDFSRETELDNRSYSVCSPVIDSVFEKCADGYDMFLEFAGAVNDILDEEHTPAYITRMACMCFLTALHKFRYNGAAEEQVERFTCVNGTREYTIVFRVISEDDLNYQDEEDTQSDECC